MDETGTDETPGDREGEAGQTGGEPGELPEGEGLERTRRQDPDAPGLGAVPDDEGESDLPEPNEPG